MKISIDPGPCTALVRCECGWSDVVTSKRAAWLSAARHLKAAHNDLQAGYNARHNAYMIDRRKKQKRTRGRVDKES